MTISDTVPDCEVGSKRDSNSSGGHRYDTNKLLSERLIYVSSKAEIMVSFWAGPLIISQVEPV